MAGPDPIFSRVSPTQKAQYDLFFNKTDKNNIQKYATGTSLTNLVDLAENVTEVIDKCNPMWGPENWSKADDSTKFSARQWQIDHISEVKFQLSKAIEQKKNYYQNHFLGIITKFFLKCFGMWNNGFTASIIKAEDFMLFWDSKCPLIKQDGKYIRREFFFPITTSVSWINEHLLTDKFFNYTSSRTAELIKSTSTR